MSYAVETKDITKSFGGFTAVNKVSLSIEKGELFGLLGPNGAGKTTLIKMLSTLAEPTGGWGRVWGYDIVKEPSSVRQCIGVVFQDITLDDRLTGRENLEIHGRLYGLDGKLRRKRMEEVLALVEMTDRADSIVKTYSGGMMRRLEIARGLMHRPNILFLDEPTLGLDPQTRVHIWEYIKTLTREEGVTIVLTTHYMEEADYLCSRIGIIDHGGIAVLDSPGALKERLRGDVITLELVDTADMERMCAVFGENGLAEIISCRSGTVSIAVKDGERMIPFILNLARDAGISILSAGLHKPTLNDVFLHHTGRAIRDKETGETDHLNYRIRTKSR